jgi:hypothetical protein
MTETRQLPGRLPPDGSRSGPLTDVLGLPRPGEIGTEPAVTDKSLPQLARADAARLIAAAARAPSIHNTQPWRFRLSGNVVELHADLARQLHAVDPDGREMLVSCGGALFGLRLGLRRLGYVPEVSVLPDAARPSLVGRVWPVGTAPLTSHEAEMIAALPHRHTHRGPFAPGDVSRRLVAGLRMDAVAERADLVVIRQADQLSALIDLVTAAAAEQAGSQGIVAERDAWVRPAGIAVADGISARARVGPQADGDDLCASATDTDAAGLLRRLPQRDFGLAGTELPGGYPPSVTAVLTTDGDTRTDWIRAGQALHRVLLHAATRWVFASLQSQPLESPRLRAELRDRLALPGFPVLLLQFGRSNVSLAAARRPAAELGLTALHPGAGVDSL